MRGARPTLVARHLNPAGLVLLLLVAGCASCPAPWGWLPPPDPDRVDVYGGWIVVTDVTGAGTEKHSGELIAIGGDSLFVLTGRGLEVSALREITHGDLFWYDTRSGGLAGWTVIGTLSCFSHGFIGLLTGPIWIILGSLSTATQSWQSHVDPNGANWSKLIPYCRFPQGLPPELDRRALQPRSPRSRTQPAAASASRMATQR